MKKPTTKNPTSDQAQAQTVADRVNEQDYQTLRERLSECYRDNINLRDELAALKAEMLELYRRLDKA